MNEELEHEQGYLEWAYQRVDETIDACRNGGFVGDGAVNDTIRKLRRAKIDELEVARNKLLIGRLDMTDDADEPGTWYVGRAHVDGDADHPAVVDWRAPLSERFYQADHNEPLGVGRRRRFQMRSRHLVAHEDEILTRGFIAEPPQLQVADAPRQAARPKPTAKRSKRASGGKGRGAVEAGTAPTTEPVTTGVSGRDLLLAELEQDRRGEMHDIVATIQADQDRLIRAPSNRALIVQGGPGTGKTVVGLHRAAYLLYQQRQGGLDQSLLIVGPNPRFIGYVAGVLPSLGEQQGTHHSVASLCTERLTASEQRRVRIERVDDERAAQLKGGALLASVIEEAVWRHAAPASVEARLLGRRYTLPPDEVVQIIAELRKRRTYNDARRQLADDLAQALGEKARERAKRAEEAVLTGALFEDVEAARKQLATTAADLLPALQPRRVVHRLLSDAEFCRRCVGASLPASLGQVLVEAVDEKRRTTSFSTDDVALLDEAAYVLDGRPKTYTHVVVDEAQELTPMQWRAVRRRTRQASITILGDLAQGTSPWSPDDWHRVEEFLGISTETDILRLQLGYRVPKPIVEFASVLLPVIAPGVEAVDSFRSGSPPEVISSPKKHLAARCAAIALGGEGSVAVIAPAGIHAKVGEALESVQAASVELLTPDAAKGLEFDTVLVVEPAEIAKGTRKGLRQLFVALTRPTKRLVVLHNAPLPPPIGHDSEPAEIGITQSWETGDQAIRAVLLAQFASALAAHEGDQRAHRDVLLAQFASALAAHEGDQRAHPEPGGSAGQGNAEPVDHWQVERQLRRAAERRRREQRPWTNDPDHFTTSDFEADNEPGPTEDVSARRGVLRRLFRRA